jgi:transposase
MSNKKTIKETALELYGKKYNIQFISEFLGVDATTVKSWILTDDPKKQFTRIQDVPDKPKSVEKLALVPAVKNQIAEDMPAVIKGLTLVGYSIKEIADLMQVSEESLTALVSDIDEIAEAYNYSKHQITIKVAETLLASILPKTLKEEHYKMMTNAEGKVERFLVKEVVKEIGGHVEGLFKWLEFNAPEKWSQKNRSLADLFKDSGIALMPSDVEEGKWTEMASDQQDVLVEMMDNEKRKLNAEYSEES